MVVHYYLINLLSVM